MAIQDISLWLKSGIESAFEMVREGTKTKRVFDEGVTQDFLVEFFNYTCTEKEWLALPEHTRRSLIGNELRRLQNSKKITTREDDEFITSKKIYIPAEESNHDKGKSK